jgi:hypothetical protein
MNPFITKDLYFASYLHSRGCPLESHKTIDGVTFFQFRKTSLLDTLVQSYFASDASVNPLDYDRAVKSLRTLALGPKTHAAYQN